MKKNNDLEQIIAGCKAGRQESFEKLIDRFAKPCYGYFYRLTGNRQLCDELLSDLFVKLVSGVRGFRGGSFESWLFRIASNVFYDHLRQKQQQKKLLEVRKQQLEAKPVEQKQSDLDQLDNLQIQLNKLDTDTRELIMLRYYSQLSFKELAQMRAEPIGTTLAKVHRGLKKLRELMEQ
jgi:RNA polymerase sigma-70 factor (ECF subfamily)